MSPRTSSRLLRAILLGLSVAGVVLATAPGLRADPGNPQADEAAALGLINQERAAHGLDPIKMLTPAQDVARDWADSMATEGKLAHNPNFSEEIAEKVPTWTRAGENVGVGANVPQLHTAFMDSPAHRDNVLGNFQWVGIGAHWEGAKLWVTLNFASASTPLTSRAQQWMMRAWGV